MPAFEHFRNRVSGFAAWCIFPVVYLGGALLFLLGLIFSAQAWWVLVHQHGNLWEISAATAEIIVLATAFFLVAAIPLLHRRETDQVRSMRAELRSGVQRNLPISE
ncbi:MAG: hypothetical protein P8Z30_16930 [Acidobacteriota bacterium]